MKKTIATAIAAFVLAFSTVLAAPAAELGREPVLVAYITDLEGNIEKFNTFVAASPAFERGADGKFHVKEGCRFVFGGDALDRFTGSLAVARELVRLKEEAIADGDPERVVLILGNRDVNKMRLTSELSPDALAQKPLWIAPNDKTEAAWRAAGPQSAAERLKHIFANTMGAPDAFELFRAEIGPTLTDAAVTEAYLAELAPGGAFDRLIALGQLAHRIGDTLFVHGGVTAENLGFIPGRSSRIEGLGDWITALNQWFHGEYEGWAANRYGWNGRGPRPGEEAIEGPMPLPGHRTKQDSVITGRNVDRFNNQLLPPPFVRDQLRAAGIRRVVVGHSPCGDVTFIIRDDGSFEVVCGDNSYSTYKTTPASIHLSISSEGSMLHAQGRAQLTDGSAVAVELVRQPGDAGAVGLRMADGGTVVGFAGGDSRALYSYQWLDGYGRSSRVLTEGETAGAMPPEPAPIHDGVYQKHVAYVRGAFDHPGAADRALVEELLIDDGVDTVILAVDNEDAHASPLSLGERMGLLNGLLADLGSRVIVRAIPYSGSGRDILFRRVAQLHPASVTFVAPAPAAAPAAVPPEDPASEARYAAAFHRFRADVVERLATLDINPALAMPDYVPGQSEDAWLEKFIRSASEQQDLSDREAAYLAAAVRSTQFTAARGKPSPECHRHLLGDGL